jgi:hypothetical protein
MNTKNVRQLNKENKAGQGKIKPKDALDCYSADSGVEAVEIKRVRVKLNPKTR